jgi:hypothetical protein
MAATSSMLQLESVLSVMMVPAAAVALAVASSPSG